MTRILRLTDGTTAPPEAEPWDKRTFYVKWAWVGAVIALAAANSRAWLIATRDGFALPNHPGFDFYNTYVPAAQRWLSGHGFYYGWQMQPYDIWNGVQDPILYPPTTIPLFAAFTVLPAFLYWTIPLTVIGWAVWKLRPRPLALAACILLAVWPNSLIMQAWFGNPTIWIVAALALATTGRAWAAPFVLLKPTLAPFALWGTVKMHTPARSRTSAVPSDGEPRSRDGSGAGPTIRPSRQWLLGLALLVAVSAPFLPEWLAYLSVLTNARNGAQSNLLYSLWNVPAMLIPVVAWLGTTRPAERSATR